MTTAVREKPILFSGPLVRALIAGKKSMTRRVISPQPTCDGDIEPHLVYPDEFVPWHQGQMQPSIISPWEVGMSLWVRETWTPIPEMKPSGYFTDPKWINRTCWYAADNDRPTWGGKWRPSIFMPRSMCRIILEITAVRVERLQEITEEDAECEGFSPWTHRTEGTITARQQFRETWHKLNGTRKGGIYAWDRDPFVWCISFRVLTTNGVLPSD